MRAMLWHFLARPYLTETWQFVQVRAGQMRTLPPPLIAKRSAALTCQDRTVRFEQSPKPKSTGERLTRPLVRVERRLCRLVAQLVRLIGATIGCPLDGPAWATDDLGRLLTLKEIRRGGARFHEEHPDMPRAKRDRPARG